MWNFLKEISIGHNYIGHNYIGHNYIGSMWNFLKEISTNGDMQTMDVVYPASPMML